MDTETSPDGDLEGDRTGSDAASRPTASGAIPTVYMWSGGKDSAYALWQLSQDPRYEVRALATMVTKGYDRTKWHQIRLALMHKQAEALGLPLLAYPDAPG